jgi:hypothetical protein
MTTLLRAYPGETGGGIRSCSSGGKSQNTIRPVYTALHPVLGPARQPEEHPAERIGGLVGVGPGKNRHYRRRHVGAVACPVALPGRARGLNAGFQLGWGVGVIIAPCGDERAEVAELASLIQGDGEPVWRKGVLEGGAAGHSRSAKNDFSVK